MSSMQLSGLTTGINTETLIAQLMEIEKRTLYTYEERLAVSQETKSVYSSFTDLLKSLQDASSALSDSDKLVTYKAKSSDDDIIGATADIDASEGSHNIIVKSLASCSRFVQNQGLEYKESVVGAGTFIFSYNHKEMSITTTSETSLKDLVGLINNASDNPGVTASILYHDKSYHLILTGDDAGSDYEIKLNESTTEELRSDAALQDKSGSNATESTLIRQLSCYSGSISGGGKIVINGTDSEGNAIAAVELTITNDTTVNQLLGEINDAFEGIAEARIEKGKIVLVADECGTSELSMTLSYDDEATGFTMDLPTMAVKTEGGTAGALSGFVATDFTETQQAKDCQIKVDGYPTGEGEWITRSSNSINDVITGVTLNLYNTTDEDGETISLNKDVSSISDKMAKLVNSYNSLIGFIKENSSYEETTGSSGSEDEKTTKHGVFMGDYLVSVIKDNVRSIFLGNAKGFNSDTDSFLNPFELGFEFDGEGKLSFDSSIFAKAVEDNYLDLIDLISAAKKGSSENGDINFYSASKKNTKAGTYDVKVSYDSAGNLSKAWIKLTSESEYRQATIGADGLITGNSTYNSNNAPVYAECGLNLTVSTTGTANSEVTDVISVKQGFAGALEDVLKTTMKADGSIDIKQDHIDEQIANLKDKIDQEESRLTKREARLQAKFATLESILTSLQGQLLTVQSM